MKLATIVLLGILLLGSFASMQAADKDAVPADAGQVAAPGAGHVALAYTNGGASTDSVCIWYPVLLGDVKPQSLFASLPRPSPGASTVDIGHAYLIWVSDYTGVALPSSAHFTLFLIPTGTATIYFNNRPETRDWSNMTKRSTWGTPVATFVRKAGLSPSLDSGTSGTLTVTAELVSSKPFTFEGITFDFKNLIPHGMTCTETVYGSEENGTCVVVGGGQ
jgi:hypothetical protein